ncbi:hypothetical protein ACQKGL_03130 [Ensifer adhaerens]|uniref:hypothetical protein n=1 Tax=Ensifer adhaerens TaxID=106592 RepID=UPI003D071F38
MKSYIRYDASSLPSGVGLTVAGARRSDGNAGHLCFGPYVQLEQGDYVAGFRVRRMNEFGDRVIDVDVLLDGEHLAAKKTLKGDEILENVHGLIHFDFRVEKPTSVAEVRLYVPQDTIVEVLDLTIFRARPRNWSGQ